MSGVDPGPVRLSPGYERDLEIKRTGAIKGALAVLAALVIVAPFGAWSWWLLLPLVVPVLGAVDWWITRHRMRRGSIPAHPTVAEHLSRNPSRQ